MKRSFWVLAAILAAAPLFAQEEAGGPVFGAGGGGAQVFTRVDSVDSMVQVKAFLTKANITLSGDQEKTLKPTVDAALQQIRDINDRLTAQGRGGRGGAPPGSIAALANGPSAPELKKINDDLMTKITAALKPDQQAAFKKFLNDEIKKGGGFAALKIVMEEAGAPLTAEQEPQIQGLYTEDAQQRQRLAREAQGRPDLAKIAELERTTMGKVVRLLSPAQRKALLDSRAKQQ